MALSSATRSVTHTCDASDTEFTVPFRFFADSHLVVTLIDSDGDEVVQTLGVDYEVEGAGASAGGTVIMTTAPLAIYTLRIERVVPLTQETSFRSAGSFRPESLETSLDKLTMGLQQLDDAISAEGVATEDWVEDYVQGYAATPGYVLAAIEAGLAGDALPSGVYNVRATAYGALGDGVTNDMAAIQLAINAAHAAGGGTVFFPPGTYIISPTTTSWLICYSNITFQGVGETSIIKVKADAGDYARIFGATTTGTSISNVAWRDLRIDQNGAANTTCNIATGNASIAQNVLSFFVGSNFKVERVSFDSYCGINCITFNGSSVTDCAVRNCRFVWTATTGVANYDNSAIYMECANHVVTGNIFTANVPSTARGGIETHGGPSVISGNLLIGVLTGINVVTKSAADTTTNSMVVSNNSITKCLRGIRMWSLTSRTLRDVTISGNAIEVEQVSQGGTDSCCGIEMVALSDGTLDGSYDGINISGNVIAFEDEGAGRAMSNPQFVYGIGCYPRASGGTIKNLSITNNVIKRAPAAGIKVGGYASLATLQNVRITGNQIVDFGQNVSINVAYRAAFFFTSTITDMVIEGNLVSDTYGTRRGQYWIQWGAPDTATSAVRCVWRNNRVVAADRTAFSRSLIPALLFEPMSVRDWGAVGDGTTDDTVQIQAALTAITGSAGTIKIPKTTASYVINGATPLLVSANTTIESDGATLKLLPTTYTTDSAFFTSVNGLSSTYNAGIAVKENISFRGLTLDGNIANVTMGASGTCAGIFMYQVKNLTVRDCIIKDLPGIISAAALGKGFGIVVYYSTRALIENVSIDRTDRANIAIWETTDARIEKCTLKDSFGRECVLVSTNSPPSYQESHCVISDCPSISNTLTTGYHAIRFSGKGSGVVSNSKVTAFKVPAWQATHAYVVGDKVLNGGNTYICDTAGTSAGAGGPSGTGANIVDNTTRWDYVAGGAGQAIYIVDLYGKSVRVVETEILSSQYGIQVDTDTDDGRHVRISGGQIKSCEYGIYASAAGGSICIIGVDIIGSTFNPLSLGYIGTKRIIGCDFNGGTQVFLRADSAMAADVEVIYDAEPESSAGALFSGNTIRGMTNASYALNVGGVAGETMNVIGNVFNGNTANAISHSALGCVAGNSPPTLTVNTTTATQAAILDPSTKSLTLSGGNADLNLGGALNHDGTTVGFYGTAPATKATITGSRGGNAALANLLTVLATTLGLITDNTTA